MQDECSVGCRYERRRPSKVLKIAESFTNLDESAKGRFVRGPHSKVGRRFRDGERTKRVCCDDECDRESGVSEDCERVGDRRVTGASCKALRTAVAALYPFDDFVLEKIGSGFFSEVFKGIKLGWGWNYKWLCEPVDYSTTPHAINYVSMIYCYFLIKILDLMDTGFTLVLEIRGHGTLIGVINCFVHVVMYSYYLYTVAIPSAKNSMWWKKYITQLQIVQFFWAVIHMSAIIFKPDCEYPWWTSALILPHNLFILVLFIDFYIKTYIRIPNEQNVKELKNRQPNGIGCKNGSEHKNDQINEHITGKYKESEGTKLRLKENAYFVSSIDHKMK